MTIGSHQRSVGSSQDWITPIELISALGGAESFDLDPCSADPRPWSCAKTSWSRDGLTRQWFGRVWLNPPFNRYEVGRWIQKLADHGRGIALLHCRCEAAWFTPCWRRASGILFLSHRLYFHHANGRRASANSGAPACLISFGDADLERLRSSKIAGYLVTQWAAVVAEPQHYAPQPGEA